MPPLQIEVCGFHSEQRKDAERYRHMRLQAWLESCVDDLVVGTKQAKESEFNAGYDQEIDAALDAARRKP
jgi:hypothetical protein